jgi:uncharacterized protein
LVYPRIITLPRSSFFLFGPRGTGKSTWLREKLPKAVWVDLLDEERYQRYLREPGAFAQELRRTRAGSWIVVDEVQRVPGLLNEVHRAIEERRLKFALCGSSARKLRSTGVNLLAGRALERRMHPFLPEELGPDFDLERALAVGTLPVILGSSNPEEAIQAYVRLYLKQEIQAEALVRNLAGFARFLPVAGLMHGQVLNLSNVAREAGVARATAEGYLSVLEDTLIAFRLPAFESRLRVRERRHPKLYFVDPGIARAARLDAGRVGTEERGHLFEGLVASLLCAYRDHRNLFASFAYWAPAEASSTEVDFVVSRRREHLAIEAKSKRRVDKQDLMGLRAIAPLPGLARRILVHLGATSGRTEDGIDLLPFADFVRELADGTLWTATL